MKKYPKEISGSPNLAVGLITANPNPAPLAKSSGLMSTTIQWIAAGADLLEIHVDRPNGPLFYRTEEAAGKAKTGNWVHHGMTFYLQDVSNGKPLTPNNTISAVTIHAALEPLSILPDIPLFSSYIAMRMACTHILAIGTDILDQLATFFPTFDITVIEFKKNIELKKKYNFVNWIELDINNACKIPVPDEILQRSVVCYAIFNQQPAYFKAFVNLLKNLMDHAPVGVIGTLINNSLPQFSQNQTDALSDQKNSPEEAIDDVIRLKAFNLAFSGSTAETIVDFNNMGKVFVIETNTYSNRFENFKQKTPSDFRVVAIMSAFNEADIIIPSIQYLIDQGVDVYLIDNWSTDATYNLAKGLLGRGLIGIEKFPKDKPSRVYGWEALLKRKEELTREIQADWFIHHDVDEIRETPWPDIRLKDAIYIADKTGFNCIDYTVVEFKPTDDDFVPGSDFRCHFKYFEFGKQPGDFLRCNTWKNLGQFISLAESGGHEILFESRKIYPYKFLLKHYPIRSQSHGEEKVFNNRIPRWHPDERDRGWHAHYDSIQKGHNFIYQASELEFFDEKYFYSKYLIERLSGFGIVRADLIRRNSGLVVHPEHFKKLKAQILNLEYQTEVLNSEHIELKNLNMRLEPKAVDFEPYLFTFSRKWWMRLIVVAHRLLGRKHPHNALRFHPDLKTDGRSCSDSSSKEKK